MRWDEAIDGWEFVPPGVEEDMDDVWARAREISAAPLSYVGAGGSAVVLRAGDLALKVARRRRPVYYALLEAEYEWLETAHPLDPDHVVAPVAFLSEPIVLVKHYVEGRAYGWAESNVHQWWQKMAKAMEALDWGMPEFKDDSFVRTETGFVLVDAGYAHRLCGRLVEWVDGIVSGRRHAWSIGALDREFLAFLVRREATEGCVEPAVAAEFERRLGGMKENPSYRSWIVYEGDPRGPTGREWEPATPEAADAMRENLTFQAQRNLPERRLWYGVRVSRKRPVLELRDGIVQRVRKR